MLDTLVDTPREALAWIAVPTLVIAGALASTELKDQLARFLGDHASS